jgi:hypothetical protein
MKKICWLLFVSVIVLSCYTPGSGLRSDSDSPEFSPPPSGDYDIYVQIQIKEAASREGVSSPRRVVQAVSGTLNKKIEPKDVVITFSGDTLRDSIAEGVGLDWITNLPRGLTATARRVSSGSNTVTILVEGVPEETKNESILITIPGEVMTSGTLLQASADADIRFDIAEATMSLTAHTSAPVRDVDPIYISGSVGNVLVPQDILLTLKDAALKEDIPEEAGVPWITNLPSGLRAAVNSAAAGARSLTLTITGTPGEVRKEPVKITIPAEILDRQIDLEVVPGEELWFDIAGVDVNAVMISGFRGIALNSQDLSITLLGGGLAAGIAPETTVNWITNMPAGLSAKIKSARAGASVITLTVSGTPLEESREPLKLTIPQDVLDRSGALVTGGTPAARFNIRSAKQSRYGGIASGSSHPGWTGRQVGPLNVPLLPAIKDFEPVGIISITSQTVEKLEADNQYHWSGEAVNYGKLMLEAKRMGAHAIINVVIDYEDKIENSTIVRDLEPGHQWTEDELAKIGLGILKEKNEGGVRSTEENTRVITRTYTGTALAVRYIGGLNFIEAQKSRQGTD